MSPSFIKLSTFLREAIQRHGGGLAGIRSILSRSIKVIRALGLRGLLGRIRAAQRRTTISTRFIAAAQLLTAAPLDQVQLSIGVMAHVYYPDLLDELAEKLSNIPLPYTLMVSVVDESARASAQARLTALPNLRQLHIRVVPNRGRDIAPLLLSFRSEILALDLLCHVHTKKSLYGGRDQVGWRHYLLESLLGSKERLAWIFGMFQANPTLGIVYPESYTSVPLWGHTWLSNAEWGQLLAQQLGIEIDTREYLDFPAGSMFWARTQALRPLFELGLRLDAFPPEEGQIDGTLQHAIERMLCFVVRQQGMTIGMLPTNGNMQLAAEGERNYQLYFDAPLRQKINYFATDARWVSFDVFDTLVLRPFLTPYGMRDYLSHLVEKQFGITNFAELRTRAETRARALAGKDVDLSSIYASLSEDIDLPQHIIDLVRQLELSTEQRLLSARPELLSALKSFTADTNRRVVGVSDMYITASEMRALLPSAIAQSLSHIYVSCDTGWRKDTENGWKELIATEHAAPKEWLHIGDNEHADVMRPLHAGMLFPVHVLRPEALLTVIPALRSLRQSRSMKHGRWQDDLWLGLLANHFAGLGDRKPEVFSQGLLLDSPESLGYTVIGPLIVDYITWLVRTAKEHGSNEILFLSREGYLLHRAYELMRAHVPDMTHMDGHYLLASRRGVNTPSLRSIHDLAHVFKKPYTGSFFGLIDSRLGHAFASTAERALGKATMQQEVYLPEMASELIERLSPLSKELLDIAERERSTYLAYWSAHVNDFKQPIVADIGYVGSIQAQLSRLIERPLGGAYFAVTSEVDSTLTTDSWATARFYDARKSSVPAAVMQHHLLLESLLTSPSGQFSHFEQHEEIVPVFRDDPAHALRWPIISKVHAGAERFINDIYSIAGTDSLDLVFDCQAVQEPLQCVGSGKWQIGEGSHALLLDDGYTGRGQLVTAPPKS
ncbi:rhamnan synthesis F family protein [Dyella sp. 20L07]|uniref:rhamnan synthesis F family protein n=1 Tax=Dyella sp. 20L07 TaxID=3384240 RepID=UPI003D2A576F